MLPNLTQEICRYLPGYAGEGATLVPADEANPVISLREESSRLVIWHQRSSLKMADGRLDQRTAESVNPSRITVAVSSHPKAIAKAITDRLLPIALPEHTADMVFINDRRNRQERRKLFRQAIAGIFRLDDRGYGVYHLPCKGADINIDSDGGLSVTINTHDADQALLILEKLGDVGIFPELAGLPNEF